MNYAKTVIDIALSEVGYLEKKSNKDLDSKTANAGYNNYTKYGRDMHNIYPSVMDFPAAWCDCFVDWCFYKAYGIANAKSLLDGNFDDYTVASAQLYKNKNAYHKSNPKRGDQIFFKNKNGICHTGLVYDVDNFYVYTVEGNTSSSEGVVANGGGVFKKKYLLNYANIDGYGRPKYDAYCEARWIQEDNKWWYQYPNGECARNGWHLIGDKFYFFDSEGWVLTKQYIKSEDYETNHKLYWVGDGGAWNNKEYRWMQDSKGWWLAEISGRWYAQNEWAKVDGKWYYFDSDGYMVRNRIKTIDGQVYSFGDDGALK